ncbi:MAG TPA: YceI family protein [Daejeonella sp.]|nr:YceI family protein [Daejeonella sp.]
MKMKPWIGMLILILCASLPAVAQKDIYSANQGTISFFSSAPLEDIEAENNKVISLINVGNNEIAVRVPIKQFQFRNRLMQEHFNENYMESERYPHATFKGKINEAIDFQQPGTYDVSATGVLNIHGVNQKRTLKGKLVISNPGMTLTTQFDVMLEDHKIKVPKIVFNKIAEKIAVTTTFSYSRQTK